MKIKNTVLKNMQLTVADNIWPAKEINLDKDGFVSEALSEEQISVLATVPDFIVCDDEGKPVAQAVEKQIVLVDDEQSDLAEIKKQLEQALEAKEELEEKFKFLADSKTELETELANLTIDNENLKAENEELKAKLSILETNKTDEGKDAEKGEQLVEGNTKLVDGKAYVVKQDKAGILKWYRDPANDTQQ